MWYDRRSYRGFELRTSAPEFALTFLVGCPVVRAPLALAVVGARPAVAPLGAARVPARPVALGGQPVGQGELGATAAVLSHPTDQEGIGLGGAAPVVHAAHAVTVVRCGAAVPAIGEHFISVEIIPSIHPHVPATYPWVEQQ